jgi:hypothetical protein
MKRWTQDAIDLLKKYYPTKSSKYCADLLGKYPKSVRGQASRLRIQSNYKWTVDEENVLIEYYTEYGGKYCSKVLNRSYQSISGKAFLLGLTKVIRDWSKQEENILKQYYKIRGIEYCCNLLGRSYSAVVSKARKLGIHTDTFNGLPTKSILKKLTNNQVIALCQIHGPTPHYLKKNGKIDICVQCKLVKHGERMKTDEGRAYSRRMTQKFRSTPTGKFICRLRTSLNNALRSKNIIKNRIGCFRLLPCLPQELKEHLESIRLSQNNQCPICHRSYDITPWTIDHIIPVKIAKTERDVLELFSLDNLSLLCQSCNSSKGAKICL